MPSLKWICNIPKEQGAGPSRIPAPKVLRLRSRRPAYSFARFLVKEQSRIPRPTFKTGPHARRYEITPKRLARGIQRMTIKASPKATSGRKAAVPRSVSTSMLQCRDARDPAPAKRPVKASLSFMPAATRGGGESFRARVYGPEVAGRLARAREEGIQKGVVGKPRTFWHLPITRERFSTPRGQMGKKRLPIYLRDCCRAGGMSKRMKVYYLRKECYRIACRKRVLPDIPQWIGICDRPRWNEYRRYVFPDQSKSHLRPSARCARLDAAWAKIMKRREEQLTKLRPCARQARLHVDKTFGAPKSLFRPEKGFHKGELLWTRASCWQKVDRVKVEESMERDGDAPRTFFDRAWQSKFGKARRFGKRSCSTDATFGDW